MPVDVSALSDMSGVDKNVLTVFLKGTDDYTEDRIVDEVFSLKEVVDALGPQQTMNCLRSMPPHISRDEVLPMLVSEKESFLLRAATAPADDHGGSGNKKAEHDSGHEARHARAHSKDADKEKEGGFLKWIFKGKKKERSHSGAAPRSPPSQSNEVAPAPSSGTVASQPGPEVVEPVPTPVPTVAQHGGGGSHHHEQKPAAPREDKHTRGHSEKKSARDEEAAEMPSNPQPQDSITQHVRQAEKEMSKYYSFGEERTAAEVTPSVSRRQGATADDDFQAIFNQFLSNE